MSWIDGEACDRLPCADRGLQYGDGLFETISCAQGQPRWLARHLARLRLGCERLQLDFGDFAGLAAEITELARGQERCILKLILTRGSAARRGYRPDAQQRPRRILSRHPWPAEAAPGAQELRIAVSSIRLGINPALAGLKHLNRLEQVLAQQALAGTAAEETLMLSSAGDVIGGSMSNVFFVDAVGLCTPDLQQCGVAGIMREVVCDAAGRHGQAVRRRRVEAGELGQVREAFMTNVRWGVRSIAWLEGRALDRRDAARAVRGWTDAGPF